MQRCVLPLADKARPDRVRERTFIHLAADGARSCRLFRPPTTDTTAPSPNRARRTLCRAKFPSSPMAALRSTQACRYEGGHWRAAAAPPPPQPTFTFSLRHTHPPTPMPTFSLPPPLPSRSHSGDDGLGLCKAHRQERTGRQRCRGPPRRVLHLLGQHKPGPVAGAAPLSGPAAHDTCLAAACCRLASRLVRPGSTRHVSCRMLPPCLTAYHLCRPAAHPPLLPFPQRIEFTTAASPYNPSTGEGCALKHVELHYGGRSGVSNVDLTPAGRQCAPVNPSPDGVGRAQ